MQTNSEKLTDIDAAMARWRRRLIIAANKLAKLEKQRRRLSVAPPPLPSTPAKAVSVTVPTKQEPVTPTRADDPLKVPSFLDRADPMIAERMTAARKKAEADERRKMPLTGRAALAAIRAVPTKRKSITKTSKN
jgi:hypothetical protein